MIKRTVRIKIDPSMTDDIRRQRVQEAAMPRAIRSEKSILIRKGDQVLVLEGAKGGEWKLPVANDHTKTGIWSRLRLRVKNINADGTLGSACDIATIHGEVTNLGFKFVTKNEAMKHLDKNDRLLLRRNS